MIKYLSILFVCIMCGCTASNKDVSNSFILPPELQDYKVITLTERDIGTVLYVLVKKDKEDRIVIGTSQSGKNPAHTIVIDDVEYVRKDSK